MSRYQRHMDLAASIQAVTEDVVVRPPWASGGHGATTLSRRRRRADCAAMQVLRDVRYRASDSPAAGDAGGALVARCGLSPLQVSRSAVAAFDAMQGAYLGPSFIPTDTGGV